MGAEKLNRIEYKERADKEKDSSHVLDSTYTDEIVIALCGQLGTDLKFIEKTLYDCLTEDYGYDCEEISLSSYIFEKKGTLPPKNAYERIVKGMELGNQLREEFSTHILADYAIQHISDTRIQETKQTDLEKGKFQSRRKCFIINSLKHPAEYRQLQKTYENAFYLLGIFSPYEDRYKSLQKEFHKKDCDKIDTLINRDTAEDMQNGQKVEDVFVHADYFIRTSSEATDVTEKINYFLTLLFDYGVNTPTLDERAMYQATSAGANSACLSRQVGACITDADGNILSIGWNDVPSFGGGVYQRGKSEDERCYNTGGCANTLRKEKIVNTITSILLKENIIDENRVEDTAKILKKNGFKDLIEFARSIHAEMHAIIVGSQNTARKMIGGKLYCTTYPCHNCARHIVLAGIKEVYYIEPYRKSLCMELHKDAMTEKESETNKVRILMYEGVAPKSFMKFYQLIKDDRKEKIRNGEDKKKLSPKHRISLRALHEKEAITVKYIESKEKNRKELENK